MIALAVMLVATVLQTAPQGPGVEDPAIRAAVMRFYEMQEKEDIAGYLSLWSEKATRPPPAQLKYIFDSGDDKFSDIVITRATPAGNRMRVRVDVRRARTLPSQTAGVPPHVFSSAMQVVLTFEKEAEEWKLVGEGPVADDLAASMMEATTTEERETLLASEPNVAPPAVMSSLARLAGAQAVKQDYRGSQAIYEQMLFVARRFGFRKEEGEALQNIANALYFQRRFPEALATYEQRLTLERAREDDAGVAAALGGIATIRYSYAEYTEALARYREALAIHEVLDDVAGVAFTSLSIGNIAYLQGDFDRAIAAYRRSLDLNRTMFNVDGESRSLEGLGRVFVAQGDFAAALAAFDAVRKDKRMANYRARLGAVAQNIGEVHFRLGNLDAARASFEESRSHFESLRDMANVGRVLQGLGVTELVAGRFQMAEDFYKRSGSTCAAADDRECSAGAVSGLAYAQAAQEKFWDAAASYRKAIAEFSALGRRDEAARSEVGLSQALAGAGDYAGALEAAIRARQAAVVLENDDVLWRALTAEARAVRKNGDGPRALGISRAAAGVLDRLAVAALDKPGSGLPRDATAALATLAVLQAESGDHSGAFATSERLRAVEVRAGLATNERDIARGMTAAEREEERVLANQVQTRLAQLAREKGLPKPDAARIAVLEKALAEATTSRRDWMQRLFERLPELRIWRGLVPPRQLPDAEPVLASPGLVFLSFVLDDDDLLVFVATKKPAPDARVGAQTAEGAGAADGMAIEAHIAPVKRRQVAEIVASLQQPAALKDPAAWRKIASELVTLMPPPVLTRLASAAHVIIVPHDVLWRVPFDALPLGDGLVIDKASVSIAGSLESLLRAGTPSAAPDSLFAVGAPELAPARSDRIKQVAPGWLLRSAEESELELKVASAAYPADRVTVLGRAAASEAAVRAQSVNAGALHIAAPFRINAASPLFSSILLTAPPPAASDSASAPADVARGPLAPRIDSRDDGALELREVMNADFHAALVVLSDGAATSMRDGASAAHVLQWGWLAAGVPSVLVSRWGMPAAARDQLLAEFHQQVQKGIPPAAALRAAQLRIRADPATSAPINWAGWMLIGR